VTNSNRRRPGAAVKPAQAVAKRVDLLLQGHGAPALKPMSAGDDCCARPVSGHAAAALPSSAMNSRRRSGRYRDRCQWIFLIDLSCCE